MMIACELIVTCYHELSMSCRIMADDDAPLLRLMLRVSSYGSF